MAAAVQISSVAISLCRGDGWPLRPIHHPSVALASFSSTIPSIRLRSSFSKGRSLDLAAGARGLRRRSVVSVAESSDAEVAPRPSERWLLEPVGDGDTRHIGFRVPMPNSFEIVSDVVTVGRLPEKADMVIPVATVSGIHARLEKKNGLLLVTDLDSTNGTFINGMRLKPGRISTASPGSRIIFGDIHLAMFLVSKLQESSTEVDSSPSEVEVDTEAPQTASSNYIP